MEHAAQTGNNSGYYSSDSYSYPSWDYPGTDTEEVINPEDSAATSSIVDEKIKSLRYKGILGDDFKLNVAMLLDEYADYMTNNDLEELASKYGIDPNIL